MERRNPSRKPTCFHKMLGGTRYEVRVHFKDEGETVEDKVQRLIGGELAAERNGKEQNF
ncbi:MAG: transposon-encoded TnpW family protein [Ruminococcus sp.]|nr:transposon-encoded TnpW family protein [Ruminococcus sp.]